MFFYERHCVWFITYTNITKWTACITFFIYFFSIVSCTLNMHVLTHVITNIKHVYITNKMDRISKWIHGSTSILSWRWFYFWITEPCKSWFTWKISSNVMQQRRMYFFLREKSRMKSFLRKTFQAKNLSSLFYFLNVQSVSLKIILRRDRSMIQ